MSLALALVAADARAQERPDTATVWDLPLGTAAADLAANSYIDYACGTRGGPPSTPLHGWTDFARCEAEPSGLHEVYFRYDDELEYWSRAFDLPFYPGTLVYDYPVIVSALFDDRGILRGLRIVSDPRATIDQRHAAYTLQSFFRARFGPEGWTCRELPRREGEGPVGTRYFKESCKKVTDQHRLYLQTHFYRKPGQTEFDPHTNALNPGYFESSAWLEIYDLSVPAEHLPVAGPG